MGWTLPLTQIIKTYITVSFNMEELYIFLIMQEILEQVSVSSPASENGELVTPLVSNSVGEIFSAYKSLYILNAMHGNYKVVLQLAQEILII
jgi:hypothetical protein